jgi:hypothetical protein
MHRNFGFVFLDIQVQRHGGPIGIEGGKEGVESHHQLAEFSDRIVL